MLNFMTVLQQLCAKVKIEKVTSVCCSTLTYIKTQSCFSEEKYILMLFFNDLRVISTSQTEIVTTSFFLLRVSSDNSRLHQGVFTRRKIVLIIYT